MARHISLEPHLTIEELEGQYQSTKDPVECSRWLFLWLLARGLTATVIASITGYSAYWIGRIARRYNQQGPDGVKDFRHQSRPSIPLLTAAQQDELVAALVAGLAPEGASWSGRTVAAWIGQRLGRRVSRQLGWAYLRRLGARLRVPCPRHVQADAQAQADFKEHLLPLLREVATAFPWATVELWAVEIVCTQMTKTDMLTSGRGRNDIADLDIVVSDHHPVNEQFDELALLLESGFEARPWLTRWQNCCTPVTSAAVSWWRCVWMVRCASCSANACSFCARSRRRRSYSASGITPCK